MARQPLKKCLKNAKNVEEIKKIHNTKCYYKVEESLEVKEETIST